jgi:transposase
MPVPQPQECRQCLVELARWGTKPVSWLVKELGISESLVRNRKAQPEADENGNTARLTSAGKGADRAASSNVPCGICPAEHTRKK